MFLVGVFLAAPNLFGGIGFFATATLFAVDGARLAVALIATGVVALAAFFVTRFAFAQRFFCAAAIFARASSLRGRRFTRIGARRAAGATAMAVVVALAALPGFLLMTAGDTPAKIALACSRREISKSN